MSGSGPKNQLVFKRYETKFLLDGDQRSSLEELVAANMVPDEHGPSTVRNVYYDTPTALLARRSAEHPDYKEKVRTRCYGTPHPFDPVFVELKKKCDGVVYKRRCELAPADAAELLAGRGRPRTQIERELDWTCRRYEGLRPCAYLAYDRVAYHGRSDFDLRLTFDQRVRVRWDDVALCGPDVGRLVLPEGTSILEVKTPRAFPLWLARYLSAAGIRKRSISKYGRAWELRDVDACLPLGAPAAETGLV
ncbi:polyphosphate polymerase domain-containing protein [Paratractidigestivibacter sp.]|uniref:polyphosphate polymerase domain-containing protein n=1 Tax=Paratractidigestivibacter sp. TaxID=2847316 RepID=UPI002ACB155F|nr:polyphosphate polymerase domain-containing protein [Paratractidigestivibacter sp.]